MYPLSYCTAELGVSILQTKKVRVHLVLCSWKYNFILVSMETILDFTMAH